MKRGEGDRYQLFTRRALLLGAGKLGLMSALAARLYYLQVVEAQKYQTLAEENRINLRLLTPSRGLVFDRNGEPLAANRNNYRVLISADRARNAEPVLDRLDQILGVGENERRRILRELQRNRSFVPVTVRENLDWEEVARIEFNAPDLPGVAIELGQTRDYLHAELMSHVVGYVGRVSEQDLRENDDPVLTLPGMRIGKSGVERSLDEELRGRAGAVQVEVNAVGRTIRELERAEGEPGANALLTVDLELQRIVTERLQGQSASAVAMDVVTGDVLALVSVPGYDTNVFARGIRSTEYEELNSNPMRPLYNKAASGVYPPGSTYKMVTALAALDARVVDPWTRLPCDGKYEIGGIDFHCWIHPGGHGSPNLVEALAVSCDCYFYEAARRAGVDRISEMANRLGFGARTEIGLPGEQAGIQPTRSWKQERWNKPWQHGDTLNLGIGQGYMASTPLQLALMTARIANGGYEVKPRLLLARQTRREELAPPAVRTVPDAPRLRIDPQHLAMVRAGMDAVVNSPIGTANASRIKERGLSMAGKTGTAQVKAITKAERDAKVTQEQLPWHLRHHALFVCYGPVDNPRYAVSVVVEHGIGGSRTAAPIGRDLMAEILKRDPSRNPRRFRKVAAAADGAPRPEIALSGGGTTPGGGVAPGSGDRR